MTSRGEHLILRALEQEHIKRSAEAFRISFHACLTSSINDMREMDNPQMRITKHKSNNKREASFEKINKILLLSSKEESKIKDKFSLMPPETVERIVSDFSDFIFNRSINEAYSPLTKEKLQNRFMTILQSEGLTQFEIL